MHQRVSFYTLGCRLNQAETATIARGFEQAGYQVVDFQEPADMVVVNTCTVTANGDADTRKIVNRAGRRNPGAPIALVGCQAQLQAESLAELPNVKWVVGNEEKMELVSVVAAEPPAEAPTIRAGAISRDAFTQPQAAVDHLHTRANLKIQDGCDFYCLFCTIPYARGRARPRVFDDLMSEARALTRAGHRELVLTGVNVGTYDYGGRDIAGVVDALLELPELDRVRISSIEPTTIPDALVYTMARDYRLCRHLHIPLQSGSDAVLHKMNRRYTSAEYRDFLLDAHARVPGLCLGTDVLVGYPTETDARFEETHAFLRELPFAYFHVFSYSERPHAKSNILGPPLDPQVVRKRSRRLRDLSNRKRRLFMEQALGSEQPVLFEQQKGDWWDGLTDTYMRVRVRSHADLHNRLLPVRLNQVEKQAIIGTLTS